MNNLSRKSIELNSQLIFAVEQTVWILSYFDLGQDSKNKSIRS